MPISINAPMALHAIKIEDDLSPSVTFDVVLDPITKSYRTVNLAVGTMFKTLMIKDIRAIKLGTLRKEILRTEILKHNPDNILENPYAKAFLSGKGGRRPAASKIKKPTEELFEQIAQVLILARLTGDYPIKSVRQTFILSQEEAQVLVRQARKLIE